MNIITRAPRIPAQRTSQTTLTTCEECFTSHDPNYTHYAACTGNEICDTCRENHYDCKECNLYFAE